MSEDLVKRLRFYAGADYLWRPAEQLQIAKLMKEAADEIEAAYHPVDFDMPAEKNCGGAWQGCPNFKDGRCWICGANNNSVSIGSPYWPGFALGYTPVSATSVTSSPPHSDAEIIEGREG